MHPYRVPDDVFGKGYAELGEYEIDCSFGINRAARSWSIRSISERAQQAARVKPARKNLSQCNHSKKQDG